MQILVTGGAGFIGGHLAEHFAGEGHDVVVLDNFEPYYDLGIKDRNVEAARNAAEAAGGSYELVDGSITDEEQVDDLVAGADVVYHQAAQAGVRKSVEQPEKVNEYNVDGTMTLLEAARRHDVERVVLASSSSVYGKPEYLPYDEDHPTTPVSPYGVSKLASEQYARVYNEVYGLPTVALRYFTVYGPRMRPNMAMTNFVSRCLHGEPPVIYGDGTQTRDFTYVDDVKRVNAQLLEDDSADGEILNVGSTDNIDIQTLAEVVRDEIDPSLELEYTDPREGDAEHTHADISKANELLGYEPAVDIRQGVSTFIDWYRANQEWYDPLVRNS
ncbi:UDP-glucose 4-epimerase [Halobiforma lacisalsi AJ5]|uniref:UDP-glucose 4-epimerase n=1 Tax=Natronobacterium lacisalsi AJ5 TaxID=358396 RepID=M0L455_NATLA|nr:GDP-mannose 4,6-dehydratase [Halobiforma lacisalsi]APW98895.1 UDP-glucose 4-epimerase [Halobiforma lacisalsi AJ5]EMA27219.1 nucleoside-diphosphate-sugar epimerase 1 (UDP-glucose 4-epimerase) [Halobiforma lacisalsi AJ5]